MAYTRLNLSNGTKLTEEHLKHIEDGIYNLSIGGTGDSAEKVQLYLPDTIYWETGKPLYLFKHAIISAFNYENYNLQVLMASNEKAGKDYNRYFMYTPTSAENNTLTFNLYDNNHNLLDTKTVTLKVVAPSLPAEQTTVLFIGDSLTYYNRISDEFNRIMTSTNGATTQKDTISIYNCFMPAGRKSDKISIIGTQKITYKGWTPSTFHEGYSGWGWANFLKSKPFYINGALDFNAYCTNNNFSIPDVVYIGLGWNDTKLVPDDTYDTTTVYTNAKALLTAMTSQWPNTKIRLWTQNVPGTRGGIGNHPYGASVWADEHKQKIKQLEIASMYKQLAKEFSNVEVVWTVAMIDSERSLQEANAKINYRITETEILGTDYVHPADSGFFQIVDGIISDFMHCITGGGTAVEPEPNDPNESGLYVSNKGSAIMWYQDVFKFLKSTSYDEPGLCIIGKDISDSVGKTVTITTNEPVVDGAYYAFFLSALPSGLDSLAALNNKDIASQTLDASIIVEKFNVSTTMYATGTVTKTIPANAKYLFMVNAYNNESFPAIEIVE